MNHFQLSVPMQEEVRPAPPSDCPAVIFDKYKESAFGHDTVWRRKKRHFEEEISPYGR